MIIYLESVGCRLNQSEIATMASQLRSAGHSISASPQGSQVVILNTCTVTAAAAAESRKAARRANRLSPDAEIVLTGCWSSVAAKQAAALPGVSRVIDNLIKDNLVAEVFGVNNASVVLLDPPRTAARGLRRTRTLIKVQDGCDQHCTYCATTIARGNARSRPMEAIMADIQRAEAWGTQEVVLTGVQLGGYGREWGSESSLSELLLQILRQSEIPRIRLSSLEPWGLSPEFFELWGDPRLCRHLHLPLQSGCGEVLRRMGRPITPAEYAEVVYQARTHIPGLAITTDLIVGFPGESDRAFEESLAFVEQMSFARAHVFPFSPRAGTAAAKLGDPVPQNLIRERSERMRKTVGISTRAFQGRFIGECLPVLWEGRIARTGADVLNQGYSDNYIRVEAIASTPLHNTITPVRLLHAGECGLVGVVEQSPGECGP